jgi:hypothetical protein
MNDMNQLAAVVYISKMGAPEQPEIHQGTRL